MNNLREKKLNNNGFSLVELIIVIAIMAVLVGVLAPQYLKYVEKSRVSADADNVDAIVSALTVYAADPDASSSYANGSTIELTRTAGGEITDPALSGTPVEDALGEANISVSSLKLKNTQSYDKVTITITVVDSKTTVSAQYMNGSDEVNSDGSAK